jgi:hypothetical protein
MPLRLHLEDTVTSRMGTILPIYLHLLPLVLEHPKLLLSEAKLMTENLSKTHRASSDYIGDASLTALQQQALKTKSLCLPLLADNPFKKSQNEANDIEQICL